MAAVQIAIRAVAPVSRPFDYRNIRPDISLKT
jgi:hypothetical protein